MKFFKAFCSANTGCEAMQPSLRHNSQRLPQVPSASVQIVPVARKGSPASSPGVPTSQKIILVLMVFVIMLTIANIFVLSPDSTTYSHQDDALATGSVPRQVEAHPELPKNTPIPSLAQHTTNHFLERKQAKFWNEPDSEDPPGPLAELKFFSLVPFRHTQKAEVHASLTSMPMISDFFNSSFGHKRLSLAVYMEKLSRQYFEWFTAQLVQPAGMQTSMKKHKGNSGAVTDNSVEQKLNCVVEWKVMRTRDPRMLQVTSMIHPSFAQDLINIANRSLERSTVVMDADTSSPAEDRSHDIVNHLRTSSGTFLTKWEDYIQPSNVALRVAASYLLGVPEDFMEPTQILRYHEGERYVPHLDYFDLDDKREMMKGGQRVATVITWLNAVQEGGETTFPAARLTVKPGNIGDGVIFYDVKAGGLLPDKASVHSGEPPRNGSEKWIAVIWAHAQRYHSQ